MTAEPSPGLDSASDDELLAAVRRGDEMGMRVFYEGVSPRLRRHARRWLSDRDVDEVVNSVLYESIRDIDSYDSSRARLISWLLMRCHSRVLDRVRKHLRERLQTAVS